MKGQPAVRTMQGTVSHRPLCSTIAAADRCLLIFLLATLAGPHFLRADELPRFLQEPQSAIVAHHQTVTLHCAVDPPTAEVGWLFDGEKLDPSAHRGLQIHGNDLHFPHFSHGVQGAGNDGEYRCTATTSAGTLVSKPAVLSKPVLRRFTAIDDIIIRVPEGGYATLPCTAPASQPPATIRVQTPTGQFLSDSQGPVHPLPSGSVVLTDLKASDSGNYTCVAFNPVSGHNRTASHSISLTVVPSEQDAGEAITEIVDGSAATLEVTSGESVMLECPVAGVGISSVVWSRGYGNLPQGHTISRFGNLLILSVELRDGGTYICETASGQKRQVRLDVQMAPSVSSSPLEGIVTASVGDTVKLTCKGGAFPAPKVIWYYNGIMHGRPSMNNGGEEYSLLLAQVKEADEGLYVCELSNLLGHANAVLQLIVQPAKDDPADMPTDATTGESDVNGKPKEVTPVDSDDVDNNRNFHLKLQNNNKDRNGRRKTNGRQRKKNRRRKNGRKVNGKRAKLVPPSMPTITRLSDSAVMVHWIVPENDGLPISLFRVQFKEVKPNNGQWQTVDDDINAKSRRYKVTRLKPGGTYKFRIAAVYSNNDNRNSPNSRRFHLKLNPNPSPRPPREKPRIVAAKPIIYQKIHAIGITWQIIPIEGSYVKGFYIYYKPYESKDDFVMDTLEGSNIRTHLLTDLLPDTEYSITMKCFNPAGDSEYSNIVVKRTLPREGQTPSELPTNPLPPIKATEAPPAGRREPGGLDQPVILGIVLGIMLLLLVVFIAMCWWKQRQQKRRNQNSESCSKFQDQAHRIYADGVQLKKHPNGGPYPLNGMNGLALANGHGPPRHGHHRMNIDVNPLAELDHRSQSSSQRDLCPGKPYHHGNGIVSNGTLSNCTHDHTSDNNFNNIRNTVGSENELGSSGLLPNGISYVGSLQRGGGGKAGGGYNSRPYPPPSLSRSSLSSFNVTTGQRRGEGSLSQSDDAESPDEAELLARANSRYVRDEGGPPSYLAVQGKAVMVNVRDSGNRACEHRPCHGYEGGTYEPMAGSGYRMEEPAFHHWPTASHTPSSHSGKHKRRRKRPNGDREHTMKDQATNTDLSSNEGTIEFTMLNKSTASSASSGSENSVTGSEPLDNKTVTVNGPQNGPMVTSPITVGPL